MMHLRIYSSAKPNGEYSYPHLMVGNIAPTMI